MNEKVNILSGFKNDKEANELLNFYGSSLETTQYDTFSERRLLAMKLNVQEEREKLAKKERKKPRGSGEKEDAESLHAKEDYHEESFVEHQSRILYPCSLDAAIGLSIVSTILIACQGNPQLVYSPLVPSQWEGLTFADFVPPFFLFLLGVTIPLSLHRFFDLTKKQRVFEIIRISLCPIIWAATAILFSYLSTKPWDGYVPFRIPGQIQRIALTYFFGCLFYIFAQSLFLRDWIWSHWINRLVFFLIIPILYLSLIYGWQVPGCPNSPGDLSPDCNSLGYIERSIFGSYAVQPTDPDGIASNWMSMMSVFFGIEIGVLLTLFSSKEEEMVMIARWVSGSLFVFVVGIVASIWMPVNRTLWSVSFATVTAGISGLLLVFLYLLLDTRYLFWNRGLAALSWPLRWFAPFCVVYLLLIDIYLIVFRGMVSVDSESLWDYLYGKLLLSWLSDGRGTSLLFALLNVLLWLLLSLCVFLVYCVTRKRASDRPQKGENIHDSSLNETVSLFD